VQKEAFPWPRAAVFEGQAHGGADRREETSQSVIALRTVSSTAILSSAIVGSLGVVGGSSNKTRMTRWPYSLTAPLLHKVWGSTRGMGRDLSREGESMTDRFPAPRVVHEHRWWSSLPRLHAGETAHRPAASAPLVSVGSAGGQRRPKSLTAEPIDR